MTIWCPSCKSSVITKNGSIHSGKQKFICLSCRTQFVENPQNKLIPEDTRERIKRSLIERVSLEGICRIFAVSMPWLLDYMQFVFKALPDDLNADIVSENEELMVVSLQVDELWSYVGNKKKALFYTDYFSTYFEVIPRKQHRPVGKGTGKTNYVERFNCTIRQR